MATPDSDAKIERMYRDLISAGHISFRDPSFWSYWSRVHERSARTGTSDSPAIATAGFGRENRSPEFANRDLHAEVGGWGPLVPGEENKHRYGIVLFNSTGQVLLREPANKVADDVWQFAKGRPEKGEHPLETARREVVEETGHRPRVVGFVPGSFRSGGGTINHYYLGEDHLGLVEPLMLAVNGETSDLSWADPTIALKLLRESPNKEGAQREVETLEAACAAYAILRPDLSLPDGMGSADAVLTKPGDGAGQSGRRNQLDDAGA